MVATRSKTQEAAAESANSKQDKVKDGVRKDRQLELLSDLVKTGRRNAKKAKTKNSTADEEEKLLEKSLDRPTYVDPGTKTKEKIQTQQVDMKMATQATIQGVAEKLRNLSPRKGKGRGRGGGLFHRLANKDNHENRLGEIAVEVRTKKKYFSLDRYTLTNEICSWPIQALVQVLLKIDDTTFGVDKENLTKCNPKFLRKLVIEMRDDLCKAKKELSLDTTIKSSTGIFHIDTKLWEIQAYDAQELRMILEAYMDKEELYEEKAKVKFMKGELVRQLLIGMQNKMLEAEVEPYHLYLEFDYYKEDIHHGLKTLGYDEEEEERLITQEDINIILPSEKEPLVVNDGIASDDEESSKDIGNLFTDLEWIKLTKDTALSDIRQWSGYANFSILLEWYEKHGFEFHEEFFQVMSSSELRYQIVQLQHCLMEDDDKIVISVRHKEKHTFSKDTRDWEIMALDEIDMQVIYDEYCRNTKCVVEKKTNDEMYTIIMDANERMNNGSLEDVEFTVNLNTNFNGMHCHINLRDYRLNKKEASLSSFTLKEEVLTWCNKILITMIAKVMDKFGLVMKNDLKTISPKILRKYLIEVTSFLKHIHSKEIFRSAVANLGIFNSEMLDWEIENLSIKEMRLILQSDTVNVSNQTKWRGCWSQSKMHKAIKDMREAHKNAQVKGGIRFQTETCSEDDFAKFIQGIQIGSIGTLDESIVVGLRKFHLCVDTESNSKGVSNEKIDERNDANVNVAYGQAQKSKVTEAEIAAEKQIAKNESLQNDKILTVETLVNDDSKQESINLTAIQNTTLEIEKNGMFDATDEKLNGLTKAAKITPMKTPKGKASIRKGTKAVVGKSNRKKSARLEKKVAVNYEEDDMSVEEESNEDKIIDISAGTEDWQINELTKEGAAKAYMKCMEKRNVKLTQKEAEQMNREDIINNLFKAREQEREVQECMKDMEEYEKTEQSKSEQKVQQDAADHIWNQTDINNTAHSHGLNNEASQTRSDKMETDNTEEHKNAQCHMDTDKVTKDSVDNSSQSPDAMMETTVPSNEGTSQVIHTFPTVEETEENAKMETETSTIQDSPMENKDQKTDTYFVENNVQNEWQKVLTKKEQKELNNNHKVPFTGLRGQPADNLLGMQVNEFTPAQEAIQNEDKNSPVVVSQEQGIYILRVLLQANTRATNHVPTFVKKFIRVLRTADATIKILPFDTKNTNANDIITNEKDFPDTEDKIAKWAVGVEKTRFQKLKFSIRVAMTEKFGVLKDKIYDWCGKNACWVFFNNIDAERIFRAGWIQGLHPFFHNKNRVKETITRCAPHLKDRISVYTRNVVQNHFDEKKTKTVCEAIAIDGDYDYKSEILKMLCDAQRDLTSEYTEARFFPFRRSTYLSAEDQIVAMKSQNEYNDTTNVKDVVVNNPRVHHNILNQNTQYDFLTWISKFQLNGGKIFSEVEETDLGKVRLIYKSNFEPQVCELMANLFTYTKNAFGSDLAKDMLGDESVYAKMKDLHSAESQHAYQCAQHFRSIPKDKVRDSSQRMRKPQRSYAQATKSKKNEPRNDSKNEDEEMINDSRDNNSTEENSQDSIVNEQIAELSQAVSDLKEQISQTKPVDPGSNQTQEMASIQIKVEENRKEFMDKLEDAKKVYTQELQKTETKLTKMIDQKEEKFTQQLTGMKEFFKDSLREGEERANARAEEQKQASDKILDILLGRGRGTEQPPNVVEPKACSHYGAVR